MPKLKNIFKGKEIPEDGYTQEGFSQILEQIKGITKEDIKRTDWYLNKYEELKSEIMQEKEEEWQEVEDFYKGEQLDEDTPKTVNVILPSIEGQVSSLVDKNLQANAKGKGYSDHLFASTVNPILHTILKENKIKRTLKKASRRYIKVGNTTLRVGWDEEMLEGMGLPKFYTPLPSKVFVDDKITEMEDIQEAEYIIEEIGHKSILWAKKEFGEDKANAISIGNSVEGYEEKGTGDDEESFTLIYVWTRNNEYENLQRLEMSRCGVPLRFSDPSEPFYAEVNNKYPYFMVGLYQVEGEFYHFGDGQLLIPVQKLIDKLYREILTAVKYSAQRKTFIDPSAKVNPNEFNQGLDRPIYAKKPKEFIYDQQGVGINPVVFNLLESLMQEVQKMTRFSALMTGNNPEKGMTATQAGIQMQQGNNGIQDKKMDLAILFSEALEYSINLCMEFWSAAVALRVSDNEDDFEWVDARQLTEIPMMMPTDREFENDWNSNELNADKEMPQFMQLEVEEEIEEEIANEETGETEKVKKKTGGKVPATKKIALDIDINIGEGLPTSKVATYNIILSLAQLQLPDEQGIPRPLLSYKDVKKMIEEIVGIKISEKGQPIPQPGMGQPGMGMPGMGMPGGQPPLNNNDNIPNAGMGGQPTGGGMF